MFPCSEQGNVGEGEEYFLDLVFETALMRFSYSFFSRISRQNAEDPAKHSRDQGMAGVIKRKSPSP